MVAAVRSFTVVGIVMNLRTAATPVVIQIEEEKEEGLPVRVLQGQISAVNMFQSWSVRLKFSVA